MLRAFLILTLVGLGNFAHADDILPRAGIYHDSSLFKGEITELRFGANGLAEITRKCVEKSCEPPFEAFDVFVQLVKYAEVTNTDDSSNGFSAYRTEILDPKLLWGDAVKSQTRALQSKMEFSVYVHNGFKTTLSLCLGKDSKPECTVMRLKN